MGRDGKSNSPVAGTACWALTCPGSLQMVFYIEACESGSMMNHLPDDINGRWLSFATAHWRPSVSPVQPDMLMGDMLVARSGFFCSINVHRK